MKTLQTFLFRLLVVGLFAVPLTTVNGAYLESDHGSADPSQPVVPPPRPLPPTPRPLDNPLRTLVRQVEVGEPARYRGLVVFPLNMRSKEGFGIVTLDSALARGWLTIQEQDTPSVPTLRTKNTGRSPVFLMAGEILLGGRQNRIVREDVLLPAESGFVDVPVYCGEQRRWEGGKQVFQSSGNLAGRAVRSMAAKAAPQSEVWQSIDSQLSSAKVEAPTRNYQAVYDDKEVQRAAAGAVQGLRPVLSRETVGVVVYSRGRLLSCDVFSDPELLAQLWDKICRAQAVDEYVTFGKYVGEDKSFPWPDRERVRSFLSDIAAASVASQGTPGSGEALVVSGEAEGRALVWREQVVHAALFPGRPVEIQPMPRPRPGPGPMPRPPMPIPEPMPRMVE